MEDRPQCGLLPLTFSHLFESRTGRQQWGGYDRCREGGRCKSCPVQRRHLQHDGIDWPGDTPLLLARARPLPLSEDTLWADPAAGRSVLHLFTLQGQDTGIVESWWRLRNTMSARISWHFVDAEGEAAWLVRDNPAAGAAVVRTKRYTTHTRHALCSSDGTRRLALLTCRNGCAHSDGDLRHLTADLADADASPASLPAPDMPEHLPGVPQIKLGREDGRTVIRRNDATTHINVDVPADSAVVTAVAAHVVRLTRTH
ncbi:hypothetical protein ACFW2K_26275 [Streptomyces nigra]|uniref:Uncharacterized protein n=1 Tax=Streptomyces sp. FR1 TaxID=349971 RepID=V9Z0R3_9ACTN|nr:hypothetical protein [Streptomyces sp. FR1]AHE39170.1 hypothetical protein pFRL3_393c [Streptomyces sp. FR1]